MAAFCCKLLDERGGIVVSTDLTAETVDAAIRHAAEAFHKGNKSSSPRRVHSFEVWSGTSRLFPPQPNPAGPNVAVNGVKLIVVDDDQDVRSVVTGFLVDAGYSVLEADDGAQALALLTDDPSVRMMISDIRLPRMSGIELAEEAVRRRPDLRVILISRFSDQQSKWPLLSKPFRSSKLCDLVAREMVQV